MALNIEEARKDLEKEVTDLAQIDCDQPFSVVTSIQNVVDAAKDMLKFVEKDQILSKEQKDNIVYTIKSLIEYLNGMKNTVSQFRHIYISELPAVKGKIAQVVKKKMRCIHHHLGYGNGGASHDGFPIGRGESENQ